MNRYPCTSDSRWLDRELKAPIDAANLDARPQDCGRPHLREVEYGPRFTPHPVWVTSKWNLTNLKRLIEIERPLFGSEIGHS